jgi:hypothetical protein
MRLLGMASIAVAVLMLGACSEGYQDAPDGPPQRDLDPTPTKLDGSESHEFDATDLERAQNAGWLVEYYCRPSQSQAQYEGCLAHVTEDQVCSVGTPAAANAIKQVQDFAADPCDRQAYGPGKP